MNNQPNSNPQAVLAELKTGNRQFVNNLKAQVAQTTLEPLKLIDKQTPKAIVLGCSDSRVPVELIFNQVIGDLFVIRVAGNVATPTQVGSVEFGASVFNAPLVIVLGHTDCGAIKGAIQQQEAPQGLSPNLSPIIEAVTPLLQKYKPDKESSLSLMPHLNDLTEDNVKQSLQILSESPVLKPLISNGNLLMVGAVYSVKTGEVQFLKSDN